MVSRSPRAVRGNCRGLVWFRHGSNRHSDRLPHQVKWLSIGLHHFWRGSGNGGAGSCAADQMPPEGWLPEGWEAIKAKVQRRVVQSPCDCSPREMLKSGSFYLLYLMMTLVTASGLMLAAQLKPIGVTYGYDKYAMFGGYTVL